MTKDIRTRLEFLENDKQPDIYVYARAAKKQIATLLKNHHMARKGLISNA
jgi:hypothetical protein